MIRRLLIANRGEIAVRIVRTARARGIETVAVHSEADATALHVRMADVAVAIGPAAAAESYLRLDRLIEAARTTGADAVHPGYGFLAENAAFAEAVIEAGLIWIGPPPAAIRAMGPKDTAKRLMEEAGVPVVPGYHGEDQDDARLAAEAEAIGWPVLVKARAGGGGKGMRAAHSAAEFAEALARARSEAKTSFGDDAVLIERLVANPRHIEVQVFADRHGGVIHLFERDCSAQRRHQKVIEEAPAPGMTPAFREAMGRAAVEAARAVGYEGAGTVEFIVDGAVLGEHGAALARGEETVAPRGFYFMEMNTRLQVEHPVTEAVTGLDLVDLQIDVALGERVPAQDDLRLDGHAVEVRLYAENPAKGFLPQTGRLDVLRLASGRGLRVDAGVEEGDRVEAHYDPMIAKLVAHGPTRDAALGRLGHALAASDLQGLDANLGFLGRLIEDPGFRAGRLDTGLIARGGERLAQDPEPEALELALAAAVLAGLADGAGPLAGWRAWGAGRSRLRLVAGSAGYDVAVTPVSGGVRAETPLGAVTLGLRALGDALWAVSAGDVTDRVYVHRHGARATLARPGRRLTIAREDRRARAAEAVEGGDRIVAPLPGLLRSVEVAPGAAVAAGTVVAVIEAMKMEHALRAPRDGVVESLGAAPGAQVAEGALIVALAPDADKDADTDAGAS